MTVDRKRIVTVMVFILVIALATWLRFRHLDTTNIESDQSFTLNTAMRWVNGGAMPLAANVSSIGFVNPPMIEYLYAVALRIWPDVLSVALLTMISGIVAVVVTGWSTYKVFGKLTAFWTMLIFAVNPWSVYYSQLIWNQTMVPVFSVLTFAGLFLYFAVEQRAAYLIMSFVAAACMTQVHPGSAMQLLTMGIIFVIFWRKLRVRPILIGSALFVFLYIPYLMYENGVGWRDVERMLEVMRQPSSTSIAAMLISADLLRARGLLSSVRNVVLFDNLATLILAITLPMVIWIGLRTNKGLKDSPKNLERATGITITLLWFIVPLVFYLRSADEVYLQPYYLISQLPAHFVLIGLALSESQKFISRHSRRHSEQEKSRRLLSTAAWMLAPLPLLSLIWWQVGFNIQFQDSRLQMKQNGPQIRQVRSAIQTVDRLLISRPECQLVVISEGHKLEQSDLSLLGEFTSPERILLADGRLAIPVPNSCTIYLDAFPGSRASEWVTAITVPLAGEKIQVPGEVWRFYELTAEERSGLSEVRGDTQQLAIWENGAVLNWYTRGDVVPGTNLPLTLAWTVESQPPEQVYHLGAYLLTMDNELIAQYDGPGFDSIQWRKGDDFITWVEISIPADLPPGNYRIALAYYSWPQVERVNLVSGENTAFLEELKVGTE